MPYTNVWTTAAPLDTQAANQGAVDFRATKLDVMQRIASFGAGVLANRPTPEVTSGSADWTGVMYWATDTQQAFMWNGTAWVDISSSVPTGSGIAHFLATTGASVNVDLAAPPTAGQVLEATDATHATWQTPAPATQLATSGSPVNVGAAAPPSIGQVLTATGATSATWQALATIPTVVLKKGTNAGDYSITTLGDVDGTNLSYTVVIPVGWSLIVATSGVISITASAHADVYLNVDGSNVNAIEVEGAIVPWSLNYVVVGDGSSHTVKLQSQLTTGGTAIIQNSSSHFPTMVFTLTPTN